MTTSNSNTADFLSLAVADAIAARPNLIGGTMRIRDMGRNMFLAATALDSKVTVDGMISNIRKDLAWDKPRDWTTTVGGSKRPMLPEEIAKIKTQYDVTFSYVRFFVGEFTATDVPADCADIRASLESGETALSTAYKAIKAARKEAAKKAEKAEAEAASAAALAEATANVPPRDAEAEARDAELTADATLIEAMERVAELLAACAVPLSPAVVAAMELLDLTMQDACDRNDALAVSEVEREAIAA